MSSGWTGVGVLVCFISMAAPGSAQTNADQEVIPAHALELPGIAIPPMDASDLAERMTDLKLWVHDYTEWKKWSDKWLNKREFGWLAVRERRSRPDPPAWLAEDCRGVVDNTGTFAEACRLLADWNDDYVTAALRQQTYTAVAQREAPTKSAWWRHVHLDGFWPMTQSRASVFGLLVHATIDVADRLRVRGLAHARGCRRRPASRNCSRPLIGGQLQVVHFSRGAGRAAAGHAARQLSPRLGVRGCR